MNMAKRPVVIPMRVQISDAARRIDIMPGAAVQAGVHHADVKRPGHRKRIQRQQAARCHRLGKADAMHRDQMAACIERFGLGLRPKHPRPRRRIKLARDL